VGDKLQNNCLSSIITYPKAGKPAVPSHLCLGELFLSCKEFNIPEEYFLAFSEEHIFTIFVEVVRSRYKWLRIARRLMEIGRN